MDTRLARSVEARVTCRFGRSWFAAVIMAAAFMIGAPRSAAAASYYCRGGNVSCLIDAINAANQDPDPDSIFLDGTTYTLTAADNRPPEGPNGLPVIRTTVQIFGMGPTATFIERASSPADFRIFEVAAPGLLYLDSLAIQGGNILNSNPPSTLGGGGLLNLGTLVLNNVVVQHNAEHLPGAGAGGGGIYNLGKLVIGGSTVYANVSGVGAGGGILNLGTMTITRTSIRSNSAVQGGGVASGSATGTSTGTIDGSDIVGNNGPRAGGVLSLGGLTITATTIANNLGQGYLGSNTVGGVASIQRMVTLESCTVTGNDANAVGAVNAGGVLSDGGDVELRNTVLANNYINGTPTNLLDCAGPVSSLGHNFIGVQTGCAIVLQPTDFLGDPRLDVFSDRVGADGLTTGSGHFPLLPSSPAIDSGDPGSCPSFDQRMFPRADGDLTGSVICDRGATEFPPIVNGLIAVTSTSTVRDRHGSPQFPFGTDTVTVQYQNVSSRPILRSVTIVNTLTNGNMLLNCDPPAPGGVGARLTPDVGTDLTVSPNETFTVIFVIGLKRSVYGFVVDVIGYPQ